MTAADRRKIFTKGILTVLMILIGAAVTVQIRALFAEKRTNSETTEEKIASYEARIRELEAEKKSLQEEYDRNSGKYTDKLEALAGTDEDFYAVLDRYNFMIQSYYKAVGIQGGIFGQGITITVNDSISGSDPYNSLLTVHDTTLLMIVNELKAAGATGISVNGERVVPMTEFLCVGPAVRVNGTKLFPPFVISAQGDTEKLDRAIRESSVYQTILSRLDVKIDKALDGVANSAVYIADYNKSYKKSIDLLKITEVNPTAGRSNK